MAFQQNARPLTPHTPGAWAVSAVRAALVLGLRVVGAALVLAVIVAVVVTLRLLQGPLAVPELGRYLAERMNAQSESVRVETGTMVLTLGDGKVPAGLEFRDVRVWAKTGEPLFTVPRISTSFRVPDLVRGRIRPIRLSVIEADAQFIRAPDGRIRFGLGGGAGVALQDDAGPEASARGMDAAQSFIDAFVGDAPPIDELVELERVEIIGANLAYVDRKDGGSWETRAADLSITRDRGGAKALLRVDDIAKGTPGAALEVRADRRAGAGATELSARFGRLDTAELARQLPDLGWLNVLGATFEGAISATIDDAGQMTRLNGEAIAERGTIRGADIPFDQIMVAFRLDEATGHLVVDRGRIAAPAINTEFDVAARLDPSTKGLVPGIFVQVGLAGLTVDRRDLFARRLEFERGQASIRWDPDRGRIHLADGWLRRDGLVLRLDGQITETAEGLVTDIRAAAPRMDVKDLIRHWPRDAAVNARTWIRDNIRQADLIDLVAHLRLSGAEPQLALDSAFEDLEATYIQGMSPILAAAGQAHVSYHDLYLEMTKGRVVPGEGAAIDLAGSSMAIRDFWGEVTPADVALTATGPLEAVLTLIDQRPLSLVTKLGVDLGTLQGRAEVVADLSFPLIQELRVEDVEADASAVFRSVSGRYALGGAAGQDGAWLELAARQLALRADTAAMQLDGDVTVDGVPLALAWTERYGATNPGRNVVLKGSVDGALLRRLGAGDLGVTGAAPASLSLTQQGAGPTRFDLSADLAGAALALDPLGWTKARGRPGTLTAKGSYDARLIVDELALTTETLEVAGRLSLTEAGALAEARLSKIAMPRRMTLAANIRMASDGVPEVFLTGEYWDISDMLSDDADGVEGTAAAATAAETPPDPVRLRMDIKALKLSESLTLRPASGRITRRADGAMDGEIEGKLGPRAPIDIALDLPADRPGSVTLTAPDAGEVLRAADLYRDAQGGRLTLTATLGEGAAPDLQGTVQIEDVRVRSRATFRQALRSGGLEDAESQVASKGIGFRKIWIPFTYDGGIVTLTDAIAVSPILGLKLNGTLDEGKDELDMVGVMSPAYVLTGALNDIPVLGKLLAGGEGEGILAMTFTLRGNARDPDLSVNPLSLLTPGFLRNVFSGRAKPGEAPPRRFERKGDNERWLPPPVRPGGEPEAAAPAARGPITHDAARDRAPAPAPEAGAEAGADRTSPRRERSFGTSGSER